MNLGKMWDTVNPFNSHKVLSDIKDDVRAIRECHENRVANVKKFKEQLGTERTKRMNMQNLFISVIDHLDDMIWAKSVDGEYIMANKAFRDKFCYGMSWDELEGKTDGEIGVVFKAMVGEDNHTFGDTCAGSDEVVLKTKKAREFLEQGNINGKLVKLVVNKSPVYDKDGVLFATCGSGRDVTDLHAKLGIALQGCAGCENNYLGQQLLKDLFDKIGNKE